ncbi:MAG: alanine racemase [Thermodesulfobacteriota bacterium]
MALNRVEIDLSAVGHNFREAKRLVEPGTAVFPVVKSDAYGHGLIPVAQVLQEQGADGLFVSIMAEAVTLRQAGIWAPVILHLPESKRDAFEIVEFNISPVVYNFELIDALSRESQNRDRVVGIYIKVDTGMGRLGVSITDLPAILSYVRGEARHGESSKGIKVLGLMSHLSCADGGDRDYTLMQLDRFNEAVDIGRRLGFELPQNHIANSAGLLAYPAAWMNLVRPGIMIYGAYPGKDMQGVAALRPVMTFKSKVIQVKKVPAGASISYGRRYVTPEAKTIAVVPVGYDTGYSRSLSNRGEVLVRQKRAPVLGTVCMCLTMIDVSHIEGAAVGDEVVIFGRQGDQVISVDEVADRAGTISYDLLCAVGSRNPRLTVNP